MPNLPARPGLSQFVVLALGLSACAAHSPRFPGPLGPVGGTGADPARDPMAAVGPMVPEPVDRRPPSGDPSIRARIVDAARHYLEHRPQGVPDDCVGFVWAAHERAGVPVTGSSADLWEEGRRRNLTHHKRHPDLGDVAFFDDTFDRNRNHRVDDPLTHVAIVIGVDDDGTVTMAHGGTARGRTTMVMNLRHPDVRRAEDGKELNSYLRRERDDDPRGALYLSGELWRGFASFAEAPSRDDS